MASLAKDAAFAVDCVLGSGGGRNARARASATLAEHLVSDKALARTHSAELGSLVVVARRALRAGDGGLALSCTICAFLAAEACALAAPRRREELEALVALLSPPDAERADDSGSESASPTKRRKRRGFFARARGDGQDAAPAAGADDDDNEEEEETRRARAALARAWPGTAAAGAAGARDVACLVARAALQGGGSASDRTRGVYGRASRGVRVCRASPKARAPLP